eukprot:1515912-Rhodomonas_salina.1
MPVLFSLRQRNGPASKPSVGPRADAGWVRAGHPDLQHRERALEQCEASLADCLRVCCAMPGTDTASAGYRADVLKTVKQFMSAELLNRVDDVSASALD